MHIVEVHGGAELFVGGAGKEVQAAVAAQDGGALGDDGGHRRVAQHVIVAGAAADAHQLGHRVLVFAGVDKVQRNALFGPLLRGEQAGRPVQALLVQVGDHQQGGVDIAVQRVGQRAQTHGAGTCHNGQLSVLFDAHFVGIHAHLGVIGCVEGADGAAHRLGQGSLVVCE